MIASLIGCWIPSWHSPRVHEVLLDWTGCLGIEHRRFVSTNRSKNRTGVIDDDESASTRSLNGNDDVFLGKVLLSNVPKKLDAYAF